MTKPIFHLLLHYADNFYEKGFCGAPINPAFCFAFPWAYYDEDYEGQEPMEARAMGLSRDNSHERYYMCITCMERKVLHDLKETEL